MGLLSNPKQRQKIIDAVSKYNNKLCVLCYVVGVGWFLALASPYLNAQTYISENALLPGVVGNEFHFADFEVDAVLKELEGELQKDKGKLPRDWLYRQFRMIGLDTYMQNYSIKYPLHITRGQTVPGQNVYAILRARRTASTEAIVMSTPFRPKSSDLTKTTGSIVLMLGLARHFRKQPYWSKDIIFLVTDHEQIGMQAWLNGYHLLEADYIKPGELPGRSGPIQAAINLELPIGFLKSFDLKIQGLNGQLPNLDLFNLAVRLCKKEGADVTLHQQINVNGNEAFTLDGFQHTLKTMLKMMWSQAMGLPTGNHGMFHQYHIEALTIQGIHKKKSGNIQLDIAGRIVEGIFRSLNNLLERFHQSFFFYILPATNRYVSIGMYMPPFGLLCAPGLIKAIALWVGAGKETNKKEVKGDKEEKTESGKEEITSETYDQDREKKEEKTDHQEAEEEINSEEEDEEETFHPGSGILSTVPLLFSSTLMGLLCSMGPDLLASMSGSFRMNIEDGIFYGFLALFTASLIFPRMVRRKTSKGKKLQFDWQLLKCIGLIFQSLVLFSLALMNISLAFFLGVVIIPITVIVHPTSNRLLLWFQKLLLLLVSPAVLVYLTAVVGTLQEEKFTHLTTLLSKSWSNLSRGLLLTLVDRDFFGSWMFSVFSFSVLPNWLIFWGIAFCEPT
ncbi:hypothetical protein CHS0354_033886 [Potamilus streckersoni]|uniref:GPI-anchor transamidase component GPAA1 n=1 Tax=Potamilus streckersoni TaxID=2493646 RepID=A0AAE0RWR8_9BIVA|nr:hypothetical protein CHS0354_033886 [Potamilus streckersoni]